MLQLFKVNWSPNSIDFLCMDKTSFSKYVKTLKQLHSNAQETAWQ